MIEMLSVPPETWALFLQSNWRHFYLVKGVLRYRLVSNDAEEAHKGDMFTKEQVENSSLLESSVKSQAFACLGEWTLFKEANQELITSSLEKHNQMALFLRSPCGMNSLHV